jgi:hypothetical protein
VHSHDQEMYGVEVQTEMHGHEQSPDEDWYPRYHPAWTWKAQGEARYDSAHHLEDFRGPWRSLQGVDNYIYKNICKICK